MDRSSRECPAFGSGSAPEDRPHGPRRALGLSATFVPTGVPFGEVGNVGNGVSVSVIAWVEIRGWGRGRGGGAPLNAPETATAGSSTRCRGHAGRATP